MLQPNPIRNRHPELGDCSQRAELLRVRGQPDSERPLLAKVRQQHKLLPEHRHQQHHLPRQPRAHRGVLGDLRQHESESEWLQRGQPAVEHASGQLDHVRSGLSGPIRDLPDRVLPEDSAEAAVEGDEQEGE